MDRRTVLRSLGLVTVGKSLGQLISWSVTILVMRWLTPADYGLSATVFALLALLTALTEYVLINQLVRQSGEIGSTRRAYEGFALAFSFLSAAVLIVVGQYYASIGHDESLRQGMWLMSLHVLIIPMRLGPEAQILREMKYRAQVTVTLTASVLGALSTLLSASLGAGFLALLLGPMVREFALCIGYRHQVRIGFRPRISLPRIRVVLRRSKRLMLTEFLVHAGGAVPILLYSRAFSVSEVGYFATATYWALIPLSKVMNVVNQVALPIFAKVRRETETLKHRQVMLPLQLILIFSAMLYGSLALVATPFVTLVIGSQWEPMAGLLAVFCIAMPLRAVLALLISPLQANAHDGTLLKMQSLHVAASWTGALLACQLPFQWLTPIHVAVAMTSTCIGIGIGMRALGLPLKSMAAVILKTAVSAALATLAGSFAGNALASSETWLMAFSSLSVFLLVFLATLCAFEQALCKQLIESVIPERQGRQRTRGLRKLVLAALRGLGLFQFCRWLYRDKVLVIGYHGGAADTLHRYNGMLFIRSSTFERRIALLNRLGYEYISLDQLLDCCQQREAAAGSRIAPRIVLTFDDGWETTFTELIPHLKANGIPATVYLHTKPVLDNSPILNVAWSYRLWLEHGQSSRDPGSPLLPPMDQWPEDALKRWIDEESDRRVCSGQDPFAADDTVLRRMFTYASPVRLKQVATMGHISLEAHGHDHTSVKDHRYDLENNIQNCLSDFELLGLRQPKHFCYPSGEFDSGADQILSSKGIRSGVTCAPGWVTPEEAFDPYYLPRFLDSEHYSDIEFEAEVCGFLDLMRRMKRLMGGRDSL